MSTPSWAHEPGLSQVICGCMGESFTFLVSDTTVRLVCTACKQVNGEIPRPPGWEPFVDAELDFRGGVSNWKPPGLASMAMVEDEARWAKLGLPLPPTRAEREAGEQVLKALRDAGDLGPPMGPLAGAQSGPAYPGGPPTLHMPQRDMLPDPRDGMTVILSGGPHDGMQAKVPVDVTTYWVGPMAGAAWVDELTTPPVIAGQAMALYKLNHTRDDGVRVFTWAEFPGSAR